MIHSINGILNEVGVRVGPVAMTKLGVHFDRSADTGPSVLPASMDGNVTKGSLKELKATHQNQLSALKEEMEQEGPHLKSVAFGI